MPGFEVDSLGLGPRHLHFNTLLSWFWCTLTETTNVQSSQCVNEKLKAMLIAAHVIPHSW